MISLKELIKKISIAEFLTILFIFSVGISLIYKYGFYSELGVSWYLITLTPQELLISSISYIFFCLLGIGLGCLAVKASGDHIEATMGTMAFLLTIFLITLNFTGGLFKGEFYLMFIFAICSLYITKSPYQFKSVLIDINGRNLSELKKGYKDKLEKIVAPIFIIIMLVFPFYLLFEQGKNDAKALLESKESLDILGLSPKSKVKYVQLKQNNDRWILVEMKGDKVLIKKDDKTPIFKIVEYKDVDIFTAK